MGLARGPRIREPTARPVHTHHSPNLLASAILPVLDGRKTTGISRLQFVTRAPRPGSKHSGLDARRHGRNALRYGPARTSARVATHHRASRPARLRHPHRFGRRGYSIRPEIG